MEMENSTSLSRLHISTPPSRVLLGVTSLLTILFFFIVNQVAYYNTSDIFSEHLLLVRPFTFASLLDLSIKLQDGF